MRSTKIELTAQRCASAKPGSQAYKLCDAVTNGLYLEVRPSGKKMWRLRYRSRLRDVTVTLGRYEDLSLASAREAAEAKRKEWALEDGQTSPVPVKNHLAPIQGIAQPVQIHTGAEDTHQKLELEEVQNPPVPVKNHLAPIQGIDQLIQIHRELDSSFDKAIAFWRREPELAATYRSFQDQLGKVLLEVLLRQGSSGN